MADYKKVLITVPENLLCEADGLASMQKMTRSRFIREAMLLYIRENKRQRIQKQLIDGYKAMAGINVEFAEECVEADNLSLFRYEQKLTESDLM